MCGIVGFIEFATRSTVDAARANIQAMADTMERRGPDDSGVWLDTAAGVAFGFRRLAILDLSPRGHQPMLSPCGRYAIVFNGEIYNHRTLRKEIEEQSPGFLSACSGHSDTAVLLAALGLWGVEATLKRLVGMFAFALWDRRDRKLVLARDRMGEKPLYYGLNQNTLLFGSELKAIRKYAKWRGKINRHALALLMRHNYIPAPHSIYEGIHKLMPGSYLAVPWEKLREGLPSPQYYWNPRQIVQAAIDRPFEGDESEAEFELERLLNEAISLQRVADVPVGAFLSGGIDSSTVVALMAKQNGFRTKTFTIGFSEKLYNEADKAKAIADYLGTDHHELYVTPEMARGVIPDLPVIYDEPFSDSSQIPTYLVAKLARENVTVSISGDGADEIFGGYSRYPHGQTLWSTMKIIPAWSRHFLAGTLRRVPSGLVRNLVASNLLPTSLSAKLSRDGLRRVAESLSLEGFEGLYRAMGSHWQEPHLLVLGGEESPTALTDPGLRIRSDSVLDKMMYYDMVSYLPDDILVKVDRATMAVSLESRAPFLDHRIVEFAWRLPQQFKVRDGTGKWLLRRILDKTIPTALTDRPKMGFGVPIGVWLRGPLKDWAESLLDESLLREQGLLNHELVRTRWKEHLEGRQNWEGPIWNVLMFEAWLEEAHPP